MPRLTRILRIGVTAALAAQAATAQTTATPRTSPDSATVRANKKLFTKRDLVTAGAFTATTLVLFPLDRRIAQELQDSSVQAHDFLQRASTGVELIATPGAYYIGLALYGAGRIAGKPRIADLGWHGLEAVIVGELSTWVMKGVLGRARPFVEIDDPDNFKIGRGFGRQQWRSFPSGHATTAFAAAAAVTDETTLWWPESTWIVGPIMYGGATLVAVSRMYNNRHWASDVAVGALIGTFAGKKAVLASHSNPGNMIDRAMLGTFVAPAEFGAVRIGWQKSW